MAASPDFDTVITPMDAFAASDSAAGLPPSELRTFFFLKLKEKSLLMMLPRSPSGDSVELAALSLGYAPQNCYTEH